MSIIPTEELNILEPKFLLTIENSKILNAVEKTEFASSELKDTNDFIMLSTVRMEHLSVDKLVLGTLKKRPAKGPIKTYITVPNANPTSNFLFPYEGKFYSILLEEYEKPPFWAKLVSLESPAFSWCYDNDNNVNKLLSIHCAFTGRTITVESPKPVVKELSIFEDLCSLYGIKPDTMKPVKNVEPEKQKTVTFSQIESKDPKDPYDHMAMFRSGYAEDMEEKEQRFLNRTEALSRSSDFVSVIHAACQVNTISTPTYDYYWNEKGFKCTASFKSEGVKAVAIGNTKQEAKNMACKKACTIFGLI